MLLARGQKNIFIPILPKDPTSVDSYKDNVSVAANDRCFGIDPNEDPDHYDDVDAERNALEMIPCLRKGDDGKLWFSSVWLYPRVDWVWEDGAEVEITFMYGWELMPWTKNVQPTGGVQRICKPIWQHVHPPSPFSLLVLLFCRLCLFLLFLFFLLLYNFFIRT